MVNLISKDSHFTQTLTKKFFINLIFFQRKGKGKGGFKGCEIICQRIFQA